MGAIASQITSLTIVYSTIYSDADQRKHQSSASMAFVRGIHRWPVNSPHKGPVTRKMFSFDDVIMIRRLKQCTPNESAVLDVPYIDVDAIPWFALATELPSSSMRSDWIIGCVYTIFINKKHILLHKTDVHVVEGNEEGLFVKVIAIKSARSAIIYLIHFSSQPVSGHSRIIQIVHLLRVGWNNHNVRRTLYHFMFHRREVLPLVRQHCFV